MRNKSIRRCLIRAMVIGTIAIHLGTVIGAPVVSPALQERFNALLKQLDDDDWRVRDAATEKVAALPVEALPLVEAAIKSKKLSPEVQNRLSDVIGDLRRRGETAERTKYAAKMVAAFRDMVLHDYDRLSDAKSPWNALARDALVRQISSSATSGNRRAIRETADLFRAIVKAGSQDPLVRYCLALDDCRWDRSNANLAAMRSSVDLLLASKYSPALKVSALLFRAGSYQDSNFKKNSYRENHAILRDVDAVIDLMPQIQGVPLPTKSTALNWATEAYALYRGTGGTDESRITKLITSIQAIAQDPADPQVFESRALLILAGEESAPKDFESVTDKERRAASYALRERACSIAKQCVLDHPKSLTALRQAMRCAILKEDDAQVHQLYSRAVAIDPLDFDSRAEFGQYLVIKGDTEEALRFAEECFQTQAYSTQIPLLSMRIPIGLYRQGSVRGSREEFLKSDRVWSMIERGYREHLRVSPQNDTLRSEFAYWACCGVKWGLANEQFQLVGKDLDPQPFLSSEVAFYMANKAKKMAGKQSH